MSHERLSAGARLVELLAVGDLDGLDGVGALRPHRLPLLVEPFLLGVDIDPITHVNIGLDLVVLGVRLQTLIYTQVVLLLWGLVRGPPGRSIDHLVVVC